MRDENGAKKEVRGYAGTPGYTAPEVVLGHYYDHVVDFFSLGVMIYRFLCGKKPFQSAKRHHGAAQVKDDKQRNQTAELDRNVVEMEPSFPLEYFSANARSLVKGLLCKNPRKRLGANGIHEIKHIHEPPFTPSLDEIHAEGQQHIGKPPQDVEFHKVRLTPEFEKSLEAFNYVNKVIIQEEIVEVLKKVNATEGKRPGHSTGDTLGEIPIGETETHPDKQSCMARCSV
ncbi:rhodopsin kinase, partial [Reticulomyxa filosa]